MLSFVTSIMAFDIQMNFRRETRTAYLFAFDVQMILHLKEGNALNKNKYMLDSLQVFGRLLLYITYMAGNVLMMIQFSQYNVHKYSKIAMEGRHWTVHILTQLLKHKNNKNMTWIIFVITIQLISLDKK